MRNLLILVLTGVCVWLLIDRNKLQNEITGLSDHVKNLQDEAAKVAAAAAAVPPARGGAGRSAVSSGGANPNPAARGGQAPGGSWLDAHIDKGARALDNPQGREGLRR